MIVFRLLKNGFFLRVPAQQPSLGRTFPILLLSFLTLVISIVDGAECTACQLFGH